MLHLFFILGISLFSLISFAQSKIKIDANKRIFLEYNSKAWNKNPNNADSGVLILRDGITKKMARIELFETDMDNALFRGQYVLNWGDSEISPEVYLAPIGMGKNQAEQMTKIADSIENGTLLRKPFFVRSNNRNFQTLTVFDTKEQAVKAYENYVKMYGQNQPSQLQPQQQQPQVPDVAAVEAQLHQEQQQKIQEQQKKEAEIAKSRAEQEELERKKREELIAQQKALSEQQKAQKKQEAQAAADQGFKLYKSKKYPEAEESFIKATELDPENGTFYFQYGATLYQNGKTEEAITFLKLAEGRDVNEIERQYFLGLSYMKMKDYENAKKEFGAVKAYQDPALSGTSAFYLGIINYQDEDYEAAKGDFEFVLDNSQDPQMDKQAETYIEQISNIMSFKQEAKKKFIITLNLGLMYDSNILSTQNSLAGSGSPTDLAGFRWSYGGSLEYRPIYEYSREFSVIFNAGDLYSTDNKFAAKKTFQDNDPLVYGISLPYKIKTKLFDKAYYGNFTPGYEITNMNADGTGSREAIVNSTYLRNDNTFAMNSNLFSTFSLEARHNKSLLSATGDDDQTGMKYTLSTSHTKFLDDKKTKAIIGDAALIQNASAGVNYQFFRYDLGFGYMSPAFWESVWSGKISYYNENYSKHTTGRLDKNTTLMLSLSKPFSQKLSGSLSGIYTINQSTLESSDYKKYMIMTNLSWSTSL